MPKKEHNLNPNNFDEAKDIINLMNTELNAEITNLESEIAQIKQERDQKNEELQTTMDELAQEKTRSKNNDKSLTKDKIMASAKQFGMKTEEEFQTALQAEKDKLNSGSYSK
jgi:uncharacterized small protein (DUF1192 family)